MLGTDCGIPYFGTGLAGAIAAIPNNGYGIAGVAWDARIIGIEVACHSGDASRTDQMTLAQGIELAASLGADVVLVTAAKSSGSTELEEAVQEAITSGVVVVANTGFCCQIGGDVAAITDVTYPAAYDGVIAVTSGEAQAPAGSWVEMLAPGRDIRTLCATTCGEAMQWGSGGSYSAALVAGAVVLLLAREPGLSVAEVRQRLADSSRQDGLRRWGRLDVGELIAPGGGGYATVTVVGVVDAFGDDEITVTSQGCR